MREKARFVVGFFAGLVLTGSAVGLAGAGHGTYAPVVANAPLPALIPDVGIVLGLFGAPFLWGFYYFAIPRIDSRPKRVAALGALAVMHILPGLWFALGDVYFARAMTNDAEAVALHAAALVSSIVGAAIISEERRAD